MKKQKQKFILEYNVRCSPGVLFEFLSTAEGFREWFAEAVHQKDKVFSFLWNGTEERAQIVEFEEDKRIRLRWLNATNVEEYFEFKIDKTDISNQTILTITDFAEAKEVGDAKRLWEHQIKDLFHRIGLV